VWVFRGWIESAELGGASLRNQGDVGSLRNAAGATILVVWRRSEQRNKSKEVQDRDYFLSPFPRNDCGSIKVGLSVPSMVERHQDTKATLEAFLRNFGRVGFPHCAVGGMRCFEV
jgi:hypothetical protein